MAMSLIAAKKVLTEYFIANECSSSPILEAIDVAIDAIDAQLAIRCNSHSFFEHINSAQSKISDELAVFLVQVLDFSRTLYFAQASINSELSRYSNLISDSMED